MSRHSTDDELDGVAVDDAPTGPIRVPAPRVALVTLKPADVIPPAAPSTSSERVDGAPAAITAPDATPPWSPEDRARAWVDAPGTFARTDGIPLPRIQPPRLLASGPADAWGPWPADPDLARPRSMPLPVVAPPAPARRSTSALLISTIVLLVAVLAALGVALVRPDLLGLSATSPFATGGEPAAQVVPGTR
ncbi:hypothetical protein ACFPK1_20230 [Actinomycetospora rhizophila]|uniref:Uncharacterized protein n=1 Tax=Actinomycetospora rhizophila TaxID=1416876 RepID=A0ABV9ZG82_9PSEU